MCGTERDDADDSATSLTPVRVSLTPEQRFGDYLQSRGMRSTQQRQLLLKLVFSDHDHFDADQLMDRLPSKGEPGYVCLLYTSDAADE